MEKQKYEFKSLYIPLRVTENYLRAEATKMEMTPEEFLGKLRREWPVEVLKD